MAGNGGIVGAYLLQDSSSSLDEEPIEKTVLDLGRIGEMLKEKEIRLFGRGRPIAGVSVHRHKEIRAPTR